MCGIRCLGLWYEPFDREAAARRPWLLRLSRCLHPLLFLALVFLAGTSWQDRLTRAQWTVIGVFLLYLLPYIAVTYYEHYAVPLLGVKVLLVLWATDRLLAWRLPASRPAPSARPGRPPGGALGFAAGGTRASASEDRPGYHRGAPAWLKKCPPAR